MSMNLKARVEEARREPTSENLQKMWQAVFVQRAWYFVPAGEGETHPMVADLDDGVWLLAFTDFRKLDLFGRANGLRDEESGEIPMLVLAPPVAMRKIQEFAKHLDGVVFNAGSDLSFRAPVVALEQFAEHFRVFEFEGE
jgi:hypothetical protein